MKWVTMWANAQSTVVPAPAYYAKNITLRYPCFIPFDGSKIRINFDNFCSNESVTISKVNVGISKSLNGEAEYFVPVYFNGKEEITIGAHLNVYSDEVSIDVKSDQYLVISMYLADYTNLTSGVDIIGPLSKGYYAYGNQIDYNKFDINTSKSTSWVYFLANVDVYTADNNEAVICYGDSITSQMWPDFMLLDLRSRGINNVSVVRKAVSGTRILRQYECITYQSYGLKGSNRFVHEVSSVYGAKKLIIQHGINDIIHPVGEEVNIFRPMSDLPTKNDLVDGINYYLEEAKKLKLDTYVGTLLPIYNWRTYAKFREDLKNEFNEYIRSNYKFIEFEKNIGTLIDGAYHFNDGCDSGDHLHPSKDAYKIMGEVASRVLFK